MTDKDYDDLAAYLSALERTIIIAMDALRDGDAGYAKRVLELREKKILASIAEMEAEGRWAASIDSRRLDRRGLIRGDARVLVRVRGVMTVLIAAR